MMQAPTLALRCGSPCVHLRQPLAMLNFHSCSRYVKLPITTIGHRAAGSARRRLVCSAVEAERDVLQAPPPEALYESEQGAGISITTSSSSSETADAASEAPWVQPNPELIERLRGALRPLLLLLRVTPNGHDTLMNASPLFECLAVRMQVS